jgi:hypothetical protein
MRWMKLVEFDDAYREARRATFDESIALVEGLQRRLWEESAMKTNCRNCRVVSSFGRSNR